jgi:AraC-like DNA-binding protein
VTFVGEDMMHRHIAIPPVGPRGRVTDSLGWEKLATCQLQRQRRVHEWNSFGSETICGMTVDPLIEDFDAEIAHTTLGPIGMAEIRSTPATALGAGDRITGGCESNALLLILPRKGSCANEQDHRVAELKPGTMLLRDLLKPWVHSSTEPMDLLTLKLPYADLLSRVDDPLCIAGQVHSAATPEVAVTMDLIASVYENLRRAPDGPWRDALASLVLDSIAILARLVASPAQAQREQGSNTRLRRDAMQFMCRRLDDPDLSIADVAAALQVSPRCLQRAFAGAGESPSAFLQAQRLERAASLLRDSGNGTMLDIAMATGFNDAAHFSRMFARRFGLPPSRYASRAQGRRS